LEGFSFFLYHTFFFFFTASPSPPGFAVFFALLAGLAVKFDVCTAANSFLMLAVGVALRTIVGEVLNFLVFLRHLAGVVLVA
jgi:hypothetical protein